MAIKEIKSRIVHKHDIEANWNKAINFTPQQGEIIVYDIDETHDVERFKIGDGKTLAKDLPFYSSAKPDWNQNDESKSDYIQNRTHYSIPSIDITWDGVMGDKISLYLYSLGFGESYFVKVSDEVFTPEQLVGSQIVDTTGEITMVTEDTIDSTSFPGAHLIKKDVKFWYVASVYDVDELKAYLNSAFGYNLTNGTYFLLFGDFNITSLTKEGYLRQLDEQFIPDTIARTDYVNENFVLKSDLDSAISSVKPDWNQNDETADDYIKNRPFYDGEPKLVDVIPETTVTVNLSNGMYYAPLTDFNDSFINGQTYVVNFNGTSYECVARESDNNVLVGNGTLPNGDGNIGNSEPFFLIYIREFSELFFNTTAAGTYTLSVATYAENIVQIDHKYIKDMYYDDGISEYAIVEEQEISDYNENSNGVYTSSSFNINEGLIENTIYDVYFDGNKYTCTSYLLPESTEVCIGNSTIFGIESEYSNNEPFCFDYLAEFNDMMLITTDSNPHTIKITTLRQDLKQIDEKYIPLVEESVEIIASVKNFENDSEHVMESIELNTNTVTLSINGDERIISLLGDNGNYHYEDETTYFAVINGRGFYLWSAAAGDMCDVEIKVVNHKIKEEYLPIENIQSDWAENDETSLSYIKNRPGGYHIIEVTCSSVFTADDSNHLSGVLPEGYDEWNRNNEICRVRVKENGIVRTVKGGDYGTGGYMSILDAEDGHRYGSARLYDGESITITTKDEYHYDTGSSYTLEFLTDVYYKFDIKYLPSSVHTEDNAPVKHGSASYSTVQGSGTTAYGNYAHAEGQGTAADGHSSHAEGGNTTASGGSSHAEGYDTTASGNDSHAEGYGTIASSKSQHVQGECNIEDASTNANTRGKYVHIVGNGDYNTRSNAHTLDWDGNAWFAGDVYVGSTSGVNKDEGSIKLQKVITGVQGQIVGFDENGAAISQNLTPKSIGAQPERMVVTVSKIYGSDNENDSYISDYTSSQIIDAHRNGIDVIVYAAFLYEYLYFNGVVHIVNGVLFVGNGGTHSILIRNDGTAEYNKKLYQPKITGTAGQVVGFDENGNAVAQDAPSGGSSDLVVTFSMSSIAVSADTGDMSIISFSHTYDEIVAAYNEGRQVLVVFDDDTAHGVFYLTSVEADEVHFIGGGFYNIFNKPVLHLSIYKNAKNGYSGMLLCPANIVNEFEFNQGLSSKQDKITGTAGQFVVIGSDGNVTTKTIANAEEVGF